MGACRTGVVIYFIQGTITGNIKIGQTKRDISSRMIQIQSSDPLVCLKVIKDSNNERLYHRKFKHAWSHGEWFRPTPDLLEFISALPANEYAGVKQSIRPWSALQNFVAQPA
jgi:hypothetical protein